MAASVLCGTSFPYSDLCQIDVIFYTCNFSFVHSNGKVSPEGLWAVFGKEQARAHISVKSLEGR